MFFERLQTENFTNQLAKETNKQLKDLNTHVRMNASLSPSSEDVRKSTTNNKCFFCVFLN